MGGDIHTPVSGVSLPCALSLWAPSCSSILFQLAVGGPVSSVQLCNLTSSSEYLVSVLPVYKDRVGQRLQGLVTTGRWVQAALFSPFGVWHQQRGALSTTGSEPPLQGSVQGLSDWCSHLDIRSVIHFIATPQSVPSAHTVLRAPTLPGHTTWLMSLIISSQPPPKDRQEFPFNNSADRAATCIRGTHLEWTVPELLSDPEMGSCHHRPW